MIYFEKELVEKLINKYSYYFNNFDKKDPRLYAFPALLSKSLTSRNKDYWDSFYKISLKEIVNFFRVPFLRLIITYFRVQLFCNREKINGKTTICLLTRSAGIRDNNSLEDYRFKGLEQNLAKNNYSSIYFYHGNYKKNNARNIKILSNDFDRLTSLILFIKKWFELFSFNRKKRLFLWNYDLNYFYLKSKILSIYLGRVDKIFFLDFFYENYPLFLSGHYCRKKLIGSMHGYHPMYLLPWLSDKYLDKLKIKYVFNDYDSIFKNNKIKIQFRKILWKSNYEKYSIVIIQENQSNQDELIKFIKINSSNFDKIYVKFRPDKVGNIDLLKILKKYNLEYDELNFDISNRDDILVFGNKSTMLLGLALSGKRVFAFQNEFENSISKHSVVGGYHVGRHPARL